jgi:hypothetical protein
MAQRIWSIVTSVLLLSVAPAGASQYRASPPVAVSGLSPFADCMADEIQGNPIILDQEAEPFIAVDPTDPDHIVGTWIQDQRLNDGNGRGFGIATTFDGGASWETTVIPGSGLCTGGEFPYHRGRRRRQRVFRWRTELERSDRVGGQRLSRLGRRQALGDCRPAGPALRVCNVEL